MGAPGAGKGTQAKRLSRSRGWTHISTGDIFRQNIENNTPLGRQVKESLDAGQLAPDELACEIVTHRLSEPDCQDGYILDGFPRSRGQAEQLREMLRERGESLDMVINLQVSDDEIVSRLANRRTCPQCGRIYNLRFAPPKDGVHCDLPGCEGVELVQRDDDQESVIRERLQVYHTVCEPIVEFYAKQNKLCTVDATPTDRDVVSAKIEELVNSAPLSCEGTQP